MQYFASMIGVPVFKIYLCLVHIETKILKLYPDCFEKTIQETKATGNSLIHQLTKQMKKGKNTKNDRRCKDHDIRCTQSRLC